MYNEYENNYEENLERINHRLDKETRIFMSKYFKVQFSKNPKEKMQLMELVTVAAFRVNLLKWVLNSLN